MIYCIHRVEKRIVIELDSTAAFVLEQDEGSLGGWSLFSMRDGIRCQQIDRGPKPDDLVERVASRLILAGRVAKVAGGFLIPVPAGARDYYVSGCGYLCCAGPRRLTLMERPLSSYGIHGPHRLRAATPAECQEAGLTSSCDAVHLSPAASSALLQS